MWPKLNLSNTHSKTLNCESVKWDYNNNWGVDYCSSSLGVSRNSAVKVAVAPGECPLRWDTAHSFLKPPMSSLHPVNKFPSVPTKSTGFPSDMCTSCPQTSKLIWTLDLVAQNYLGRHGFLHNHNVNWQSAFNMMLHCFYALTSNSRCAHCYSPIWLVSYSGTLVPKGRGVTLCFPRVLWVLILWWRVRGCWQGSQSVDEKRESCT